MEKKKCIHKMNMKGHGDPWCTLFHKTADCDSCSGIAAGTFHKSILSPFLTEARSIQEVNMSDMLEHDPRCIVGTLRDAVHSKADAPIFTKHHETVMKRNKAEKMSRLFNIYGGTPERMKQLQRIKSLSVGLQMHAAQLNYDQALIELIGRPGVTFLHDEFVIDEKEWVSPFTEGELVTYQNQLARIIKITGPVVKIKLQVRRSPFNNCLDVMDWDIEKRSIVKWVVKCWRKLWHRV